MKNALSKNTTMRTPRETQERGPDVKRRYQLGRETLLEACPEEEVLAAINADDAPRAAKLLRELPCLTKPALMALADLLDGDAHTDATLPTRYAYRLTIASWGLPGRKKKNASARAKSPHKRKSRIRPSDAMIAAKVRLKMDQGETKTAAIVAVAKTLQLSPSLVSQISSEVRNVKRITITGN